MPYIKLMIQGLSEVVENEDTPAMREPRARPSKVWWNAIAMRRTMKAGPVETERARPMKTLWKRMPASRRRHCRINRFSFASLVVGLDCGLWSEGEA
jgi:hypothetical protein